MENTPRLYSELVAICGQPGQWRDVRHLQTLAWMVVGLIQAECVRLTAWVPFVQGRAHYAQSTQRRFRRWLAKRRVEVARGMGRSSSKPCGSGERIPCIWRWRRRCCGTSIV